MVIMSIFGKIERTVLSEKLGLYISNIRGSEHEDWFDGIVDELLLSQDVANRTVSDDLPARYPQLESRAPLSRKKMEYLVDEAIFLDFRIDYDRTDPDFWKTSYLVPRACEGDYAENLLGFMSFASGSRDACLLPSPVPFVLYSSNWDYLDYRRVESFIHMGSLCAFPSQQIAALKSWGALLDGLLSTEEDFLLLDYLVQMTSDGIGRGTEPDFMRLFSLCQFFLEKDRPAELDWKLPQFLSPPICEGESSKCAVLLRQIRNKIAHGDFSALDEKLEEYSAAFMDGKFWFDYREQSRRNWILEDVNLVIARAIQRMAYMLFYDRGELESIKETAGRSDS